MDTKILSSIYPLDAFLLCIFLWIVYIGLKQGVLVEFFKLLSVFVAIVITLHYYVRLAGFLYRKVAIPRVVNDILAFVLLWIAVVMIFRLLREAVFLLRGKRGENFKSPVWLTLVFSVVRGVLVCSLVSFALLVAGNKPLAQTSLRSQFIPVFAKLSANFYQKIYDKVVGQFFPQEEFNESALFLITFKE